VATSGPYTAADLKRWNDSLGQLERTRVEIEQALAAGFPCQEQQQACTALRDQIMQMKKVYFPNKP